MLVLQVAAVHLTGAAAEQGDGLAILVGHHYIGNAVPAFVVTLGSCGGQR